MCHESKMFCMFRTVGQGRRCVPQKMMMMLSTCWPGKISALRALSSLETRDYNFCTFSPAQLPAK